MTHVRAELDRSERRVCRVLGQARSTQRYAAIPRDGDEHLVRRMHELVRLHPRRSYRLIWGMLRLEGWRVNRKRVYRLWGREGLRVPTKRHKRTRLLAVVHAFALRETHDIQDAIGRGSVQGRRDAFRGGGLTRSARSRGAAAGPNSTQGILRGDAAYGDLMGAVFTASLSFTNQRLRSVCRCGFLGHETQR